MVLPCECISLFLGLMDTYVVNSFCYCADVNNVAVGIHYLRGEGEREGEGVREEEREGEGEIDILLFPPRSKILKL